ncbi:hypothetical protein DL93DRAFT_1913743 [Clavulina sp. PMI_390]|nr:hypothetical protein DL93DRAFT_1913743 [Clavulina sp. PMI_390]
MAPTIFDRVYGTAFVGTFISSLLLGVISVQTYLYFQRYGKDPLATKIVVGLLWAMQAMQVAVSTRAIYHYLISSLLDPWALAVQTWEFSYYGTHLVLTSAIVQTFFLYRLWSISRQRVLVVVNGILILGSLVSAVRSYLYQLSTNTHAHESWSVNAWLGLAALADTSIAVSLVIVLRSQRTGYK